MTLKRKSITALLSLHHGNTSHQINQKVSLQPEKGGESEGIEEKKKESPSTANTQNSSTIDG